MMRIRSSHMPTLIPIAITNDPEDMRRTPGNQSACGSRQLQNNCIQYSGA